MSEGFDVDGLEHSLTVFRMLYEGESASDHEVMGWGIRFPSGQCYIYWNQGTFPSEMRLEHPHVSQYGSLSDVQQATEGHIQVVHEWAIDPTDPTPLPDPRGWAFESGDVLEPKPQFLDADTTRMDEQVTVVDRLRNDDGGWFYYIDDGEHRLVTADSAEMLYTIAPEPVDESASRGGEVDAALD